MHKVNMSVSIVCKMRKCHKQKPMDKRHCIFGKMKPTLHHAKTWRIGKNFFGFALAHPCHCFGFMRMRCELQFAQNHCRVNSL